jgi:hypothetical protein
MSDTVKGAIAGATIAGLFAVVVAILTWWLNLIPPGPADDQRFPIAVLEGTNGNGGIENAELSFSLPELTNERTDSAGKFTLKLSKKLIGKELSITATKSGYESKTSQILSLQPRDEFYRIYLPKLVTAAVADARPAQMFRVYQSGPKASGSRDQFSDFYKICSDAQPGYHIAGDTFALGGDRRCGAWAECIRDVQTPDQVCWKFRLQGHNELPPPGQALSEGILSVTWAKG